MNENAIKPDQIWVHDLTLRHRVKVLWYRAGTVTFEVVGKTYLCSSLPVKEFKKVFRPLTKLEIS